MPASAQTISCPMMFIVRQSIFFLSTCFATRPQLAELLLFFIITLKETNSVSDCSGQDDRQVLVHQSYSCVESVSHSVN